MDNFIDHISHGVNILRPFLEGVRSEYAYPFINAILGHHGSLEHVSPMLPKMSFGWLVHHADLWDSHNRILSTLNISRAGREIKTECSELNSIEFDIHTDESHVEY